MLIEDLEGGNKSACSVRCDEISGLPCGVYLALISCALRYFSRSV